MTCRLSAFKKRNIQRDSQRLTFFKKIYIPLFLTRSELNLTVSKRSEQKIIMMFSHKYDMENLTLLL